MPLLANSDTQRLKRTAPNDFVSNLAYLIGFRDWAYRRKAVDALGLSSGDRVVEIGCGTGRNFSLLEHAVGPGGAIIAIDASKEMIGRSAERAARHGWKNVQLAQSDAASYEFPDAIDGVLSTYTLVVVPEYDRVIERAFHALKQGRRCAVLDQKLPSGLASWLVPIVDRMSHRVDYSHVVGQRRVWESIERHAASARVEDLYFGFAYLAVGEKAGAASDGDHDDSAATRHQ
jgi:demethylmenaquinone methyltransferase/2-methoxy-6-polyprenyl-1,4-benzoquinol methylase